MCQQGIERKKRIVLILYQLLYDRGDSNFVRVTEVDNRSGQFGPKRILINRNWLLLKRFSLLASHQKLESHFLLSLSVRTLWFLILRGIILRLIALVRGMRLGAWWWLRHKHTSGLRRWVVCMVGMSTRRGIITLMEVLISMMLAGRTEHSYLVLHRPQLVLAQLKVGLRGLELLFISEVFSPSLLALIDTPLVLSLFRVICKKNISN